MVATEEHSKPLLSHGDLLSSGDGRRFLWLGAYTPHWCQTPRECLHLPRVRLPALYPPCRPRPVKRLPMGDAWLHEPKLDGWRIQAVKVGSDVAIYSRNGRDLTKRFAGIADAVRKLPCRSVALDCEVILVGGDGIDFNPRRLRWRGTFAGVCCAALCTVEQCLQRASCQLVGSNGLLVQPSYS